MVVVVVLVMGNNIIPTLLLDIWLSETFG